MNKRALVSLLLPLAALACGRSEPSPPPPTVAAAPTTTLPRPVFVASVTLGKELGPDKKVVAPMDSFGPKDTLYASVETGGAGKAKLRALWSFVRAGKTAKVDETTLEIDANGPAVNEFHVAKPSGWPKGEYKLEVFLDDAPQPAATKSFNVA
jgi:hypothetical protein